MIIQVCGVLIIGFLINLENVSGTITVISEKTNDSILKLIDEPAGLVRSKVSVYGSLNYVVYANPAHACSSVQPPPFTVQPTNFILVARRHDCYFYQKVLNAQNAGYAGIIIHNVMSEYTFPMYLGNLERLSIFATFVGEHDGHLLRDKFNYTSGYYYITIEDDVNAGLSLWLSMNICGWIMVILYFCLVIICICGDRHKGFPWQVPNSNSRSDRKTSSDSVLGSGRDCNNVRDSNSATDSNNATRDSNSATDSSNAKDSNSATDSNNAKDSNSATDSNNAKDSNSATDSNNAIRDSNSGTDSKSDTESVRNTDSDSDSDTDLDNVLYHFQGFNKTSRKLTLRLKARVDPAN